MADTFTKIYLQIVFAVQGRENSLSPEWRKEVFKFISGVITNDRQKSIIVNGVSDHIHCFVGMRPAISPSDLVRDIKANSSRFINERKFLKHKFHWQEGFGAFSYSHRDIDEIYHYVERQEQHHAKESFRDEYLKVLLEFDIEFKDEYLFKWN